jgi:hypothetical protein
MKTTVLIVSLLLFSCQNTGVPAASAIKSDTTKSVLNKLIHDGAKQTDSVNTTQYDSVKDDDIMVAGCPIAVMTKQGISNMLKQADSISTDPNDEDECVDSNYHIKASVFTYCKQSLLYFNIQDNDLAFSVNGKSVKIGDDESILKPLFPLSYSSKYKLGDPPGDSTRIEVFLKYTYRTLDFTINGKHTIIEIEVSSGEAD